MIKKLLTTTFLCSQFFYCSFFAQTKVIPRLELTNYNGVATGSGIYFGATMTSAGFTLTFEGPADRWLAFGLGVPMSGSDIFIYTCGNPGTFHTLGWTDYKNSVSSTSIDASQDWTVISNNVSVNQRTVVAYRVLNTGDPNDAVINFSASSLDVIWARGATADYTIAYHGTTNRRGYISVPWQTLTAPTASFSANTTTVCQGGSVSFINSSVGSQNGYLWNFQSGSPPTSSNINPSVIYTTPGTYSVALTATNSIGSNTFAQVNYITVTPTVVPTLAIGLAGGNNTICAGSNITFTSSSANGGSSPTYQWKINGVNAGSNSPSFSSSALLNNSIISCILTSNANCASPVSVNSASLNIVVNSTVAAAVSVVITGGNNPMCSTSSATFFAAPTNGGTTPFYQWRKNNLPVGSNSQFYSSTGFSNSDQITCELSSNASCASSTFATSAAITITISTLLTPSVTLNIQTGTNPSCVGQSITYSAIPFSGGNNPVYTWLVNGSTVTANGSSFTTSFNNAAQIQCVLFSNASCASPNTASSSVINLTVNPIPSTPVISITSTNICAGGSATLTSTAAGASNWSNGSQTSSITVSAAGTYSVSQTVNGCTSPFSSAVTISVMPLPIVSLDSVPDVCHNDGPVILNGIPAGGIFSGNGIIGNSFDPAAVAPGGMQISYRYTDVNGCTNSASVVATVQVCDGITLTTAADERFEIFPNPAGNSFNIFSGGRPINYQLSDLLGNVLMQGTEKMVDTSSLLQGVYVIAISSGEMTIQKRLIIAND